MCWKTPEGVPYADLERDDPARETALRAIQLRTSLSLAVMSFRVADLVIRLSIFMMVLGATFIIFIAPAVFYSAQVANHYDELIKNKR